MTDGDTSKFFYDEKGNLLREERTKNGVNYKVNYIYAGGEAIGFTLRGQRKIDLKGVVGHDFLFYYVKDAQGNVRKIVDGTGNCVVKYNYNAWGKETVTPVESTWEFPLELNSDGTVKKFCIASDIAELNRLTYRGYFYNREIGLYYLINRYYDPETGRFISADDAEYLDFQTLYGSNRYIYCLNNPVNYIDPDGSFPILSIILGITALIGIGLTIGGVASGNNTLTAVGLTMVAIPALISGGMAIAAGIGGATLTGIVGGVTAVAGIGSCLFASAEYQEAFTGNNWMLDAGMSESWYNGLMLTTAAIATLGTFASLFCYNFNIKSIGKIGQLTPSNHPNEGYWGIRFKNARGALRSLELQNHVPHGLHFQLNSWNPMHMSVKTIRRWTWFLTRM